MAAVQGHEFKAKLYRLGGLTAAFLALNAPFWWLQSEFFLSRPWMNIELMLPLVVAARSLPAGVSLLLVLWGLDLASSSAVTFYFTSPLEFLRSAQFLSKTHWWSFATRERLLQAMPFVLCAAWAFTVMRHTIGRLPPWRTAFALAVLVVIVDVANGSSMFSNRAVRLFNGNPAGSPTLSLLVRAFQERAGRSNLVSLPAASSGREAAAIESWVRSHQNGSVLFVLVESLGWHRDPAMRQWLQDRLTPPDVRARYTLRQAQVPFAGATTAGELRELCGLAGNYRGLSTASAAGCLPRKLLDQGWTVVGFHGFSRHMFDRGDWWPLVGLRENHFAEDLVDKDHPLCGAAFAGACDAAVLAQAAQRARVPRTMAYVLTLNSHLPLKPIDVPPDLAAVCQAAGAGDDICWLTATLGSALSALALQLSRPGENLPLVVVVGDHAPPFSALAERNQYNQKNVPAFVLVPAQPGPADPLQ